jgi:hypothetical protein
MTYHICPWRFGLRLSWQYWIFICLAGGGKRALVRGRNKRFQLDDIHDFRPDVAILTNI